jgi:hypothetical protein
MPPSEALEDPPERSSDDPLPLALLPTATLMRPALPAEAIPLSRYRSPEFPTLAVPVRIWRLPDVKPAAERTLTSPVFEVREGPLTISMGPPIAVLLLPPET